MRRRLPPEPGFARLEARRESQKRSEGEGGNTGGNMVSPRTSEPAAQPPRTARRRRRDSNPRGRDFPHLTPRSEEHTSELQSQSNLVCRLLLEKKKMQS